MPTVETMNLHELAALFREYGIPTSETHLADGIEQRQYPFGICIRQKSRRFEIYRKQVLEYLNERAK